MAQSRKRIWKKLKNLPENPVEEDCQPFFQKVNNKRILFRPSCGYAEILQKYWSVSSSIGE